jgi:hypothetical protein
VNVIPETRASGKHETCTPVALNQSAKKESSQIPVALLCSLIS